MSEKQLTPFDFINSAGHSKIDLMEEKENETLYNPFIVNRGFSYFIDTILHANEMNLRHMSPKLAQYRYYMGAIKSKKRFSKWAKKPVDEKLDLIQEHYQVRREVAKQYVKILTETDLEHIKLTKEKGGSLKR